ncbi:T7SS effector LXG polymorphic toxin [Priestia megaterium]|uniref:T7SS effector LXG polymorphic toxin n=1 Tax=Priestia megaterium TaxID=1404 RepID=UPI00207A24B4|nr:T7SS effector LXG polymorphic toxin [Priestia megaterium]USL27822.1 EndoU domain-containing protein [Priestia megaterium]WDM31802.1 EndoU domain-containing protein [Priestia megaterium]
MGKVYEANTLLAYAKDRVQAYKAFDEQLEALKKALHAMATLDHEFQGKGADNIKGFYKTQVDTVTHWKSLVSSHRSYFNSIADYAEQAKLKGDTVVDVSFLEQELAVAHDRSKQMVEQQHAELESILSNIEDIIHITPFSTDAFEDDLSATEKKRTDTLTAVEELDNQLSSEYGMLDSFYESVQFSVNGLEQMTSQGGSAYQLVFDANAYKNSEAYKTQQQIDKVASGYVEGKAEQKKRIKAQKEAIEAEKQRQIQANKPWYEKGLDIAGELTGYYDYKRAVEGVDPVTHAKLSTTQRVTAGAMAAAGFIPFVGWAGRAVKGGSVVYKTTKGMSAAHHAMALYQTPKAFKTLQQTEKGLYGLLLTNGMYEYTMGKDLLGNNLTKEEKQTSLLQAAGGLLGVGVSVKGTAGIAQDVKQAVELSGFLKSKIQYSIGELSSKNLGLTSQRRLAFAEQRKNINTLSSTYVKNITSEINDSTMMLFSRSSEGAQSTRGVTSHTVEHVFHGQVNRRQKAVGYHHESMMGGGKVVEVIDPPDSRGIYRAKVSVNGIEKIPVSTFFPKDWNRAQVLNAINEAYENKRIINRQSGLYAGRTSEGLTIRMYINSEGKINTAFPIRERGGNQ